MFLEVVRRGGCYSPLPPPLNPPLTGACKFTRDVKCHDTCHLHGDVWLWACGHVRTKKSTRIIAQATQRCSCTGYSLNYFDSAYCTTDSRVYSVVGHIECQTRSGLSTSLLLIHLMHVHQTIKMADLVT